MIVDKEIKSKKLEKIVSNRFKIKSTKINDFNFILL